MSFPFPGCRAWVKLKSSDTLLKPPKLDLTMTSFKRPSSLNVKLPPGEISPETGFVTDAYSFLATSTLTPSCVAMAFTEHLALAGLMRNLLAAYMDAMNRVRRADLVLSDRDDSRIVNAEEVIGAM